MIGRKSDKLTIVEIIKENGKRKHFKCLCDCGLETIICSSNFTRNKECGVCANRSRSKKKTKHGMRYSPEYGIWNHMNYRCKNKRYKEYHLYGGRGISVCDRWRESFENFIEDMGKRPTSKHSLDRIDNGGNYEKSNCRWANKSQQAANRRSSVMITYKNRTMCIKEWSVELNIPYQRLNYRIQVAKWPIEKAIETPKLT